MSKSLKFAPNLVPLIFSGEKTCTWRVFDDKDLKAGDLLTLIEKENGNIFAKAIILSVSEKMIKEINKDDYEGHEKFESQEKMFESYKKYYGDKVTPETLVKIVKFRLIKNRYKKFPPQSLKALAAWFWFR